MKLLYACDDFVRAWVKDKIPHMADGDFGPSTAIGVVMGDRLIAGAVYHNWQPQYETIEMSVAAIRPNWTSRPIIHGLLAYVFETVGAYRLSMVTTEDNDRARKLMKGLGFTPEGIAYRFFGQKNAAMYRLTRDEWKAGRFHIKDFDNGQVIETA